MSEIYIPHWRVGDKKLFSQFDARNEAFVDGGPAYRFVFLEDSYDTQDWTQEPSETWDQLCIENAMRIRHKYKKLKLFFSAGRDSGHVFRVFENAGIPIDELVLPYSPYHPLRYWEHVNHVLPVAQELCRRNPGMTIREVAHDREWQERIYKNEDWLTTAKSTSRLMFYSIYDWSAEIQADPDFQSGTCGYMFGMEKPRIRLIDGNYIFQMLDKDTQSTATSVPNIEHFYWAPEFPKLMVKQCWIMVNHLEAKYPNCDSDFVNKFQQPKSQYYDELCHAIGRGPAMRWEVGNGLNKVWSPNHPAIKQLMQTAKDERFKGFREWALAMEELKARYPHFFQVAADDGASDMIGIWGKEYFIKKQNKQENDNG